MDQLTEYLSNPVLVTILVVLLVRLALSSMTADTSPPKGKLEPKSSKKQTFKSNAYKGPTRYFTQDELAAHNKMNDLWLASDGKVYDVTPFVDHHPGGDMIINGAGQDATVAMHGVQHPEGRVMMLLPEFYQGEYLPVSSSAYVGDTRYFSRQDVAKHTSRDDCWIISDGKVYDVTPFVQHHPGGDTILEAAGMDASDEIHGAQHPQDQMPKLLANFYQGELKQ